MPGYAAATSLMVLHRPPRHERVLLCAFPQTAPAFPITLLEKRDNGNVVFFCGAGVSRPTGLPGFVGLAEQTIAKLGAPADAKSRLLLKRALQGANYAPPLDQIFQHLQQEYWPAPGSGATKFGAAIGPRDCAAAQIRYHGIDR